MEDYQPEMMVGLTGLALLFTLYLTALELFVIHAICRYCVVSAVIVLVMFLLASVYLRSASRAAGDSPQVAETEVTAPAR